MVNEFLVFGAAMITLDCTKPKTVNPKQQELILLASEQQPDRQGVTVYGLGLRVECAVIAAGQLGQS